jgi:hypothetical protein
MPKQFQPSSLPGLVDLCAFSANLDLLSMVESFKFVPAREYHGWYFNIMMLLQGGFLPMILETATGYTVHEAFAQ